MSKQWQRISPLDSPQKGTRQETWQYTDTINDTRRAFEVSVDIGKPLNVMALKQDALQSTREYAAFLKDAATKHYPTGGERNHILACPCCTATTNSANTVATIYAVDYVRCQTCGHVFIKEQPSAETLATIFTESDEHSAIYTDPETLNVRLEQVVQPKLEWVKRIYQNVHGQPPSRLIDVGAGGGHFVEVARRGGLQTDGYEISQSSKAFAKQAFGIDLIGENYLNSTLTDEVNIITFWGLLEYITYPREFLQKAHQQLSPENGLIIVEVPRYDSISTVIQTALPHNTARHLDPTSHVNCFSDSSLATLLVETGFSPVAAWYFGLDAYELLVQLALEAENDKVFERTANLIPALQAAFDAAHFADDLIIAAIPI